jgi:hypothetical protein
MRKLLFATSLGIIGLALYNFAGNMGVQTIARAGIAATSNEPAHAKNEPNSSDLSTSTTPLQAGNPGTANEPQRRSGVPTRTPLPSQLVEVLKGVYRFSDLFIELTSPPVERLTHDELATLRYIVAQCQSVAAQYSEIESRLLKNDKADPRRAAAAKSLVKGCDRVNTSDEQMNVVENEFSRRQHAGGRTLSIAASALTGNTASAVREIENSLNTTDMLTKYRAFSSIFDVSTGVDAHTSKGAGAITASDLSESWTLALCELGGTCGKDSPDVLWACAVNNHCDATSPEDLIKRFEPTRYIAMLEIKSQMLRSLESHDWKWLSMSPAAQRR